MNNITDGQVHVPVHDKRKKILHFSDGVEELTDSDEVDDVPDEGCPIDESTMEWGPWVMLKSKQTAESILSGCDYLGEMLASALGITSPKFIDGEEELRKATAEQQARDEETAEEIREMATWQDTQSTTTTVTEPPPLSTSPVMLLEDETEKPHTMRY